jgi:hypothetical protein
VSNIASITVNMCDMCGKRETKFAGRLALTGEVKIKERRHNSIRTFRSWKLCQSCFNHMQSQKSKGDAIKEELEKKLDQIRVKDYNFKLLE